MADGWLQILVLFVVGVIAAALNVVAGGGSFLTLPALIFLGLPPTVANGTNRVGLLIQNSGAVWNFTRRGFTQKTWLLLAAAPAVAGALLGTWLAVQIGDRSFQRILAVIMIAVSLWTIWDPLGHRSLADKLPAMSRSRRAAFVLAFFGIGVWAGFIQAGVGFVILAATTWAGLNLVSGNALKVLVVLTLTPVALAIFALAGKVDWSMGFALGLGTGVGGQIGVHLTVLRGHSWIKRVVMVVVVIMALRLWFYP
ncbi:MAG: TSUP family transporter [Gemmatimonadota bacterium]